MPPPPDKISALHAAVSEKYDLGDLDHFRKTMADSAKRKAFYDAVGDQYDLGDYNHFEETVGGPKKKVETEPSPVPSFAEQTAPQQQQISDPILQHMQAAQAGAEESGLPSLPPSPAEPETERNPLVTGGKSLWNTMRYEMPASLIGGQMAMEKAPMDLYQSVLKPIFGWLDKYKHKDEGSFQAWLDTPPEMSKEQQDRRKTMMRQAVGLQLQGEKANEGLITSLDKAEDWLDYLNWGAHAVGSAAGQIPAAIATRGATAFGQEIGATYLDAVKKIAEEQGLTPEQVIDQGKDESLYPLIFGMGAGALENIGAKGVMQSFGKKEVMDAVRSRALSFFKSAGAKEAITEGAQSVLEQIGVNKAAGKTWEETFKSIDPKDIKESMAQGYVGGEGLHHVVEGAGKLKDKVVGTNSQKQDEIVNPPTEISQKEPEIVKPAGEKVGKVTEPKPEPAPVVEKTEVTLPKSEPTPAPVVKKEKTVTKKAKPKSNGPVTKTVRPGNKGEKQQPVVAVKEQPVQDEPEKQAGPVGKRDTENTPDTGGRKDLGHLEDNPEENRKRGTVTREGVEYKRQPVIESPKGKEVKMEFAKGVDETGHYQVIEADQLQPSHEKGHRNNLHFIPEAQPKNRDIAFGQAAVKGAIDISNNLDPAKVTQSPNPYSGAPTVNNRGEAIQGNSRADALKQYWQNFKDDPKGYKKYLEEHAEEFGLKKDEIATMKAPVLVRAVPVSDKRAIELGNYDVKDTESGGARRIDPKQTVNKLSPEEKKSLLNILNETEGESLAEVVRKRFGDITKVLYPKAINSTQLETLINKNTKEPNAEGVADISGLYTGMLFSDGNPNLPDLFRNLPSSTQKGVEKALPRILKQGDDFRKTMQKSIEALHEFKKSGLESMDSWSRQPDMFNNGQAPVQTYKPAEIAIARKLNGSTQRDIETLFRKYDELTSGTPGDMFTEAKPGISHEEAAGKTFGEDVMAVQRKATRVVAQQRSVLNDGRSIRQREVANRKMGHVDMTVMVAQLKKVFPNFRVVFDRAGFDKAWDRFKNEAIMRQEKLFKSNAIVETRDGARIGLDYNTDKVARERFDLSKFKKIGAGSDRTVFDMGNGKVLKVAHTPRGLMQNNFEGEGQDLLPEMYERGLNYVVVEKVDPAPNVTEPGGRELTDMLKDLDRFTQEDFDKHQNGIWDAVNKYGYDLTQIFNYDVLWKDFTRKTNWGFKDGKPIHIDGGTFGGLKMLHSSLIPGTYKQKEPLGDPEFREIYFRSKAAKKKFQDQDKFTKFQQPKNQAVPNGFVYQDTVYLNPSQVLGDTPIHEFGHLWIEVAKNKMQPLYRIGKDLIKNSPYHQEVQSNPAYSTLSEEAQLDEALAQAIGERGALIQDSKRGKFLEWLKRLFDGIKETLFGKKTINFSKVTLDDYLNMVGKELLTPGEISTISNLRMPETATFRLKHHKLPPGAYRELVERQMMDQVIAQNPNAWRMAKEGLWRKTFNTMLEGLQDKTRRLKEVQNNIVNHYLNTTIKTITEDKTLSREEKNKRLSVIKGKRTALEAALIPASMDPHGLYDLMTGRIQHRAEAMRNLFFGKPSGERGYGTILEHLTQETEVGKLRLKEDTESVAANLRKEGLSLYDLGFYAYVLHAPERNAKINAKRAMKGEKPLEAPSGMTNQEAADFMKDIEASGKRPVLEKYRQVMQRELVDKPLEMKLHAGLINQETYDKLSTHFKDYTPLAVEEFAVGNSAPLGKLTSGLWGSGIKKLGMGTDAHNYTQRVNPFVQLMFNYEKTLAEVERNNMLEGMANLIKKYPDERIWGIKSPKYKIEVNEDGEVQYVNEFPDKEVDTYGTPYMVNGKRKYILLKDKRLHDLFHKPGRGTNEFERAVAGMIKSAFSYLRIAFTGLNPSFAFPNFVRDAQDALVNLSDAEVKGIRSKVFSPKNMAKSMKAIWKFEKDGEITGEYGKAYEEMKENGGQIAWLNYANAEKFYEDTKKEVEQAFKGAKENKAATLGLLPIRAGLRYTLLANKVVEMAIRLSTYKNLRDAGVEINTASLASKNVTVNFNKQGSYNPILSNLYLFLNAGIQGSARMLTSLARSAQARKLVIGAMVGMYLLRELNQAIDDGEDDEEKKALAKLNDKDYRENIIINWFQHMGMDQSVLKIPVSYNMRGFKAISDGLFDVIHGKATAAEAASNIVGTFMSSLFPLSDSGAIPTLAQPAYELATNKRLYNDAPIMPESTHGLKKKDSERYFGDPSALAMKISEGLSGVNEGRDDLFEISPNQVDYVFDWTTGGLKNWYKTAGTVSDALKGNNEFDWNKVAILQRFYQDMESQDWRDQVIFYGLYNKGISRRMTQEEFTRMMKAGQVARDKDLIKPGTYARSVQEVKKIQRNTYKQNLH